MQRLIRTGAHAEVGSAASISSHLTLLAIATLGGVVSAADSAHVPRAENAAPKKST